MKKNVEKYLQEKDIVLYLTLTLGQVIFQYIVKFMKI